MVLQNNHGLPLPQNLCQNTKAQSKSDKAPAIHLVMSNKFFQLESLDHFIGLKVTCSLVSDSLQPVMDCNPPGPSV